MHESRSWLGALRLLSAGRWAAVWRLCRLLAGKGLGPKRRQYRVPSRSSPSAQEWADYLAQDGPSGGMQAQRVDLPAYEALRGEQYGPIVSADATTIYLQARKDLDATRCAMRRAAKRKGWPEWSLPVEVFHVILMPNLKLRDAGAGLGCERGRVCMDATAKVFLQVLAQVRYNEEIPLDGLRSQGWDIAKPNGNCAGRRVIHMLYPSWKCFFTGRLHRGLRPRLPPADHGFELGRRREAAIGIQMVTARRLARCGISFSEYFFDLANAFACAGWDEMDSTCSELVLPIDEGLFRKRYREAVVTIQGYDGSMSLAPQVGGFMGDPTVVHLFSHTFKRPVLLCNAMLTDPVAKLLAMADPVSGQRIDVLLTKFADDLAKKALYLSGTIEEMERREVAMVELLDSCLSDYSLAQNKDKLVRVPTLRGASSWARTRWLHGRSAVRGRPQCADVARYLGAQYHWSGAFGSEFVSRCRSARVGYRSLGRVWTQPCVPRRLRRLLLMAMVVSPLVSGLEARVINKGYLARLNSQLCLYAGKAMAGEATQKLDDGTYKAIGNEELLRRWKLLSISEELVVRRLGWLQSMARDPSNHMWLASVFWHFPFEAHPTVQDDALCAEHNPWAAQVQYDIDYMRCIDEGEELWELLGGRILQIFREGEARDLFLGLDLWKLRYAKLMARIPPPRWAPAYEEQDDLAADGAQDLPHLCCYLPEAGAPPCLLRFRNKAPLDAHLRFAHGVQSLASRAVVSNQRLWCKTTFSEIRTAIRHCQGSLLSGQCIADRSRRDYELCEPASLECPLFNMEPATTFCQLQVHIAEAHFPPPVTLVLRRDEASLDAEDQGGLFEIARAAGAQGRRAAGRGTTRRRSICSSS